MDAGTWLIVGGGGLDGGRRDTVGLRLVNSTKGSPSGLEWFGAVKCSGEARWRRRA